ncbi:hypothetical protein SDC9_49250 [bioreactor metagenome]|uniref:Uncharacterized protein n=1 Tax=bioreactor metagenome TaxID=1076179 RepID=A0A644WHQ2_9ZZZZ
MGTKTKIAMTVVPIIIAAIIFENLVFGLIFRNFVLASEKSQVDFSVSGISSYIKENLTKYSGMASDWGHWDDTYLYIENNNQAYIDLNMSENSFGYLDISFIIILDRDGNVLFRRFYQQDNGRFIDFPAGFSEDVPQVTDFARTAKDTSGILKIGEAFYFVCATDVTDSQEKETANGTLVFGRQLCSGKIRDMERSSRCSIDSIELRENIEPQNDAGVYILEGSFDKNHDRSSVYFDLAAVNMLEPKSAVVFSLAMPRDLYMSGTKGVYRIVLFNMIVCVAAALFVFVLLGTYITKPFKDLIADVKSLGNKNELSGRLTESGTDEFSFLRKSINSLLGEIEQRQTALIESREKLQATLISVGDGVITFDTCGRVQFLNPVAEKLTGWKSSEAQNVPMERVFNIINEYTRDPVESPVIQVYKTENIIELTNHTLLISKDGTETPIEDTAAPIKDSSGKLIGCVLVFRDFSERKEKQRRIEYLSFHDQLTGLYNRRFFEEELKRIDVARNLPLSFIYADVNGLKMINDAFGHEAGDELIELVAQVLKTECRADDIIARIGGDEFVILLPKTPEPSVDKLVGRISEIINRHSIMNVQVSVSFGWDTKTKAAQPAMEVMKSAENLMYQRKILNSSSKRGGIIKSILNTLLVKSPREGSHSKRVSKLCEEIGKAYQLSFDEIKELSAAGELHDIGKIAVDETILNKTSTLSTSEWVQINHHPEIGYRLLGATAEFNNIAEYVLAHHERWDGTGYPKGSKGEEIVFEARVIAVADAFDAMTCERPYHKALSQNEAAEELKKNAGTQFDPDIVKVFIEKVLGIELDS